MNSKITHVALVVKSKDEAVEFYTKKVGFEKKADYNPPGGERWVTVGPKGQNLELTLWEAGSPDPDDLSINWSPGSIQPIVMQVDDCRRISADLKSREVQFKRNPQENPYAVSAVFVDPDGNSFQINQYNQRGA
ncbi:MAG TPA: VOC family protein [Nitrososphaerales archaeon]|nr:VOC family protein [Nitrososphaerales archaeon]